MEERVVWLVRTIVAWVASHRVRTISCRLPLRHLHDARAARRSVRRTRPQLARRQTILSPSDPPFARCVSEKSPRPLLLAAGPG